MKSFYLKSKLKPPSSKELNNDLKNNRIYFENILNNKKNGPIYTWREKKKFREYLKIYKNNNNINNNINNNNNNNHDNTNENTHILLNLNNNENIFNNFNNNNKKRKLENIENNNFINNNNNISSKYNKIENNNNINNYHQNSNNISPIYNKLQNNNNNNNNNNDNLLNLSFNFENNEKKGLLSQKKKYFSPSSLLSSPSSLLSPSPSSPSISSSNNTNISNYSPNNINLSNNNVTKLYSTPPKKKRKSFLSSPNNNNINNQSPNNNNNNNIKKKSPNKRKSPNKKKSPKINYGLYETIDDFPIEEHFEDIPEICLNAGSTIDGLKLFLKFCLSVKNLVWGIIWVDYPSLNINNNNNNNFHNIKYKFSTNFMSLSEKYCTPSMYCDPNLYWNCSCNRNIRSMRSDAKILGVLILLKYDNDNINHNNNNNDIINENQLSNNSIDTIDQDYLFFLPLDKCNGIDKENDKKNNIEEISYLPFECLTSLYVRKEAWLKILSSKKVNKITFNTQLALMSFMPKINEINYNYPQFKNLIDPKIGTWMLSTSKVDSDLEFNKLLDYYLVEIMKINNNNNNNINLKKKKEELLRSIVPLLPKFINNTQSISSFDHTQDSLIDSPIKKNDNNINNIYQNEKEYVINLPNGTKTIYSLRSKLYICYEITKTIENYLKKNDCYKAFRKLEMPLVPILSSMEVIGLGFYPDSLLECTNAVNNEIKMIENNVNILINNEGKQILNNNNNNNNKYQFINGKEIINLSSPQQVAQLLYDELNIKPINDPTISKLKENSKHRSTNENILEKIKDKHPIISYILRYRSLLKIKSSYLDAFEKHSNLINNINDTSIQYQNNNNNISPIKLFSNNNERKQRIRGQWNQCTTRTGRLSCSNPSLQTLPKEPFAINLNINNINNDNDDNNDIINNNNKIYLNIRDAFGITSDKFTLVSADYSQIEVRLLAHLSKDKNLMNLFNSTNNNNNDIYTLLSSSLTKKNLNEVTKSERSKAKRICLAMIYGIGIKQIANQLKITYEEANDLHHKFMISYPQIKTWMDSVIKDAKKNGYIETLVGRKRYLPDINSKYHHKKATAERQAINSVIQGTASDLIKLAMILIHQELEKWNINELNNFHNNKNNNNNDIIKRQVPRLLIQIHDELLFEVPSNSTDLERFKLLIKNIMEKKVALLLELNDLPLIVNMEIGRLWGSMRAIL